MAQSMNLNVQDGNVFALALFGLCPLLVKSSTFLAGLFMGGAALCVLLCASLSVSLLRHFIPYEGRLLFILIINATWVTVLDLMLQACFYNLRMEVGIYIALLAVNATVLLIQEEQALREGPFSMLKQSVKWGLVILAILVFLGFIRELLGSGGIFTDAHLLSGYAWGGIITPVYLIEGGAVLFTKAAGAFISFGLLLAVLNLLHEKKDLK